MGKRDDRCRIALLVGATALSCLFAAYGAASLTANRPYRSQADGPSGLDPPAPPSSPGSAMYTLEDLYRRLDAGTPGGKRIGAFTGPTAGPANTGRTLDELMAKAPVTNANAATSNDTLTGKVYWGLNSGQWGTHTGSMAVAALSDTNGVVPAGYHAATNLTAVDTDLAGTNIRSGATIFGVSGDPNVADTSSGDATAADILDARRAWVGGNEVTGTAAVLTVSADTTTISEGYYAATDLTQVDSDLAAPNILTNVTILGIGGTLSPALPDHCPYPVMLPATGQTTSYRTGDDGDLQNGVAWPSPRFTDHGDGTVTDELTGLMWTRDAGIWTSAIWETAIDNCAGYSLAGSSDWRLPNVRELGSLVDYSQPLPSLPSGHPFYNVQSLYYWSSTTEAYYTNTVAWAVQLGVRDIAAIKTNALSAWPVRGGE